MRTIAAFDFDGTLTYRDTLIPFFFFAFGKPRTFLKLSALSPQLLRFPLGLQSRQATKELLLKSFIGGLPTALVEPLVHRFMEGPIWPLIRPAAWQRFQWHKAQGHTCILVSANIDLLLKPWATKVGFDHLIASSLETNDSQEITGFIQGKNCWGQEKADRLTALIGTRSDCLLFAYGDSRGDEEMLQMADFPCYRLFN